MNRRDVTDVRTTVCMVRTPETGWCGSTTATALVIAVGDGLRADPRGRQARATFLNQRRDLEAFRVAYQEGIASIQAALGALAAIDLFPAVPAPVAVLCGRELLPKVHPKVRVWDNDRQSGGFTFKLEI